MSGRVLCCLVFSVLGGGVGVVVFCSVYEVVGRCGGCIRSMWRVRVYKCGVLRDVGFCLVLGCRRLDIYMWLKF